MFEAEKIEFVNERYPDSEESRKWVLSSLKLLSDYEAEWGMDFTMQEYEPLQEAFNKKVAATYNGAKTTLIRFRRYAKWRQSKSLPCSEGVFRLEADRTTSMRDSMASSPKYLAMVLDATFDDSVMIGSIDVIYRVFLWMGFSGITDIEAVKVTDDELDFQSMTITHAGNAYPIYNEAKHDFWMAASLNEFSENKRYRKRVEGHEIMRGKANKRSQPMDVVLVKTIRPMLVKKLEAADQRNQESSSPINVGFDLTFNRVYLSGIFYRLYQKELDGYPPDFSQYALDEFERAERSDKPYKISHVNPKAAILLRLKKSIKSDYESWKRAFSL